MREIRKVLIANRGEIAGRIITTCKRLGINTVAVYSEADRDLSFVTEADEAHAIGEAPAQKSYLNKEQILKVAKQSGANAIHPGYGFLSENASFARDVEALGIQFIGPKPDTVEMMGDKVRARKTMKAAGVPVVPGSEDPLPDAEAAKQYAEKIGYPVMLKASAGGGGIGMQLCPDAKTLEKAFASNQGRAKAYFGSGDMFLEKAITDARHVEVQIMADDHGSVIHLLERDCSVQRRNQKVIEESPSPFISEQTRQAMTEAAVKAAEAVNYVNAGTVEFIVDGDEHFYFLEMNTRLQVEHPVTEMITGYDLVEWQLKIAEGEALAMTQADIKADGHAAEFRLYAEDPVTFMPSPGVLTKLDWPSVEGVRVDAGYRSGNKVTPYYDPMIAKVIVHGANRDQVLERARHYFEALDIEGIKTNQSLFKKLLNDTSFVQGHYTTSLLTK